MASKAMQRRPRFNATEYKEDFLDLIKTNPELAADSAKRVASKKVRAENQVAEADMATRELVAFLLSTVVMAGAGWWSGSMRAKRDALVADWEMQGADSVGASVADTPEPWDHESGVKNPTMWWFFPKLIVFPIGSGILAVIAAGLRKKGQMPGIFERAMTMTAISTFGFTVASVVGGMSYDRKEKSLASAGGTSSVRELPAAA